MTQHLTVFTACYNIKATLPKPISQGRYSETVFHSREVSPNTSSLISLLLNKNYETIYKL